MEEPKIETDAKNVKDYGKVSGPMTATQIRHPRGMHIPLKQEKPKTNKQGTVERLVRKYTTGEASEVEFRKQLRDLGVKADPSLNKLIAKHEAGDFVSHKQLGKEALRRVVEPSKYNGANKINLQDPSYVVKDRQGRNPVDFTGEIQQKTHEDTYVPKKNMRFIHENVANREIFSNKVYVGEKGKSRIDVQQQFLSSDPNIIKWEKGSTGLSCEDEYKPAKKMVYNERDHHKMYSTHGSAFEHIPKTNDVHRTSYSRHQANRTNFNIFGF